MATFSSAVGKKARKLLKDEYVIWLTTIDANLTPQPRPVWFVTDGDDVILYSKPHTAKVGHIRVHPNVSLHFNTDREANETVLVLLGTATLGAGVPAAKDFAPYMKKYKQGILDLDMKPEDFTDSAVLIGSSAQIADTLKTKVESAGFDEVILYFNLGLKPHARVKDEMARFMAEVAPKFG